MTATALRALNFISDGDATVIARVQKKYAKTLAFDPYAITKANAEVIGNVTIDQFHRSSYAGSGCAEYVEIDENDDPFNLLLDGLEKSANIRQAEYLQVMCLAFQSRAKEIIKAVEGCPDRYEVLTTKARASILEHWAYLLDMIIIEVWC